MNNTRGGASKGPSFKESGLPANVTTRDKGQIDETGSSRGLIRRIT